MTPERATPATGDVRPATFSGEWHGANVSGAGRLRLAEHGVRLELESGDVIDIAYPALTGCEWRGEVLTLVGAAGRIRATGAASLDAAWVALSERACALPELTTGLRAFGSRRGGDASRQVRFFAPLLQARRRLEEQQELRWRLAAFDAVALRERMEETVRAMATERYPAAPPAERALTACLLDECAPLLVALDALGEAASAAAESPDDVRFAAWRLWTARAREVFEAADRAWAASLPWLEHAAPPPEPRRRWRRRGAEGGGA